MRSPPVRYMTTQTLKERPKTSASHERNGGRTSVNVAQELPRLPRREFFDGAKFPEFPDLNMPVSAEEARTPLRVVITGGSKGLGKAMAEQFLANGDKVILAARNENRLKDTVQELSNMTGEVFGVKCDVTSPEDLERVAYQAQQKFGGVDMWICNAGTNGYLFKDLQNTPTNKLKEITNTNILGTLFTAREAIRSMGKRNGPGIIVLLEGAGGGGEPTALYAAYGATKASTKQLASSLRSELRETKIKVVTLNPGIVDTELLRSPGAEHFGLIGRALVDVFASKPDVVAAEVVPKLQTIADDIILSEQEQRNSSLPNALMSSMGRRLKDIFFPLSVTVLTPKNMLKKITELGEARDPIFRLIKKAWLAGEDLVSFREEEEWDYVEGSGKRIPKKKNRINSRSLK